MAEGAARAGRYPPKAAQAVAAPPPAVAVVDREGLVIAVVSGRAPARAFLRESAR